MWWTEKVVDESAKVARAAKIPEGYDPIELPVNVLDPINKVQDENFFNTVKQSVVYNGLYRPLILHPMTREQCLEKAELDKDFLVPLHTDWQPYLIIINGCNRYFALKELGFDAIECIIIENHGKAWDEAYYTRKDRKWYRPENIYSERMKRVQNTES